MFNFFKEKKQASSTFRIGDLYPQFSHSAMWSQWEAQTAVRDGYENNPYVYACVTRRAQAIASVPIVTMVGGDERDTPLKRLLNNPNPENSLSDFLTITSLNLDLTGSAFFKIVTSGTGEPLELWPLESDKVEVKREGRADAFITHYMYGNKRLSRDEVLHIKTEHPLCRLSGMSPMSPAGNAVDLDNESATWQKISMQNRGVPDGVFTLDGDAISADEWEEAKRQVKEQYTGSSNAREPWVVANAKFQQISLNPVEMDFINSRKMTRSEICTAFQVPEPLVGIYENATLANIETARKIFWKDTIVPMLEMLEDKINSKLSPMFRDNALVRFDTSNVPALQESYSEKLDEARKLHELGVPLTVINERLELGLELDDVAGADIGYIASGKVPTDFDMGELELFRSSEKLDLKSLHEVAYGKDRKK